MNIRIATPFLLSAIAAPVFAADYMDSAPVVSSVPVYQTISEPQQRCWTESVTSYEQRRQPVQGYRQALTGYQVTYYNGRNSTVVLPYDPGPRLPIEIGVSRGAYQSAYVGPPVGRIGYEQRRVRIWEENPYKRLRYRDDDDRHWRH